MPDSVSDPSQRCLFSQEPPRDAFTQFSEAYHPFEDAFRKFNRNKQDRNGGWYGRPVRSEALNGTSMDFSVAVYGWRLFCRPPSWDWLAAIRTFPIRHRRRSPLFPQRQ